MNLGQRLERRGKRFRKGGVLSLNLRQIEVFRAIMLTQSITGASQLLHVSQPAISRLLSHIEVRVGFILFDRIKGRLYATPEARQLFQEVEAVYKGVQRINQSIADLAEKRGLALRLCCSPSLSQTLAPKALAMLADSHPDARILLDTQNTADMIQALLAQEFELGISIQPIEHPNLECVPIYESAMRVAVPRGHALARRAMITVRDVARERYIGYGSDTPLGILLGMAFHREDVEVRPIVEVRHTHTAYTLVQHGAGVAIVDGLSLIGREGREVVTRPLAPHTVITICAVYSKFHPLSMGARELLALLKGKGVYMDLIPDGE